MFLSPDSHWDFEHPEVCWEGSTAGHKQSRRFLEHFYNNFLTQVITELMRGDALLDLTLTNKMLGDVKIGGCLISSAHEMVEFLRFLLFVSSRFLRTGRKQMSLLSLRRTRKRIWETAGWMASP